MAKNKDDYPIHFSEFRRPSHLVDTLQKPSCTCLTFIPSVEEMIERGFASGDNFSYLEKASFGDFSSSYDYEDVLNAAAETREHYEELPDHIRAMFKSPEELLNFVEDPNNQEKAVALGILERKPQESAKESNVPNVEGQQSAS